MNTVYIHYGATHYNKAIFNEVKNISLFPKPTGGLWASPEDAEFGWKEWCLREDSDDDCCEHNSFRFKLTESANIIKITSAKDLSALPLQSREGLPLDICSWVCLDFERIVADGVDAIEIVMSNDWSALHFALYGWDCDSILVLNPDVIVQI